MLTCPSCGQDSPDGFRFCGACGAALVTDAATAREERKVVTVLFCDLVGSTAQAERMDPEDVRELLSSYHEQVRRQLERFGGTVEKFIGDAVMALFGAPTAHEDDPERAVRAALAIRDWAGDEAGLQIRIGITTGEALVALGAQVSAGEGMASGDVVNTAARLQSAAPVNGILVDETTRRATERLIEYGEQCEVAAKGKATAVPASEALQARARVQVDPAGSGPLVGREEDLDALVAALRRVRDTREPQLVTLVGVPGIGKSRLVYELFKAIENGGELTFWRQGRSLPYGEGVSFWALGEIVKAQAGVLDTDDEAVAATKLRNTVSALFSEDADVQWLERHLRPLVGVEGRDELGADRREEAFAAWRRFFEALAEQRPLVLVFEDLHFADDGLLDFVDHLADWASGVPILVVVTARPELLSRRPGWGGGKANTVTLSLTALSDDQTAQLMHLLLERPVPPEVQEVLLARAGGNPLYAEEFVRMLSEGRRPQDLPENVQGLIAARIDGLQPDEKALLQNAAVLGAVFWLEAAVALAGIDDAAGEQLLHALARKEFVRRERRSSVEGAAEYAFRHLLVRDVAYGEIPRGARAEKHRLAAKWLHALGRPADHAELLAHHYLSALDLLRAAGRPTADLEEAAVVALRDAGDRAFALNAYTDAARYYGDALELSAEAARGPLLLRYGRSLSLAGDGRFEAALVDAAEALQRAGDHESAAEAHAVLTEALQQQGERDRAFEHIERAVDLVRDAPPSAAKVKVHAEWSRLLVLAGNYRYGMAIAQGAYEEAEALGLAELAARTLGNAAVARSRLGDHVDAIPELERSIELALSVGSPEAARGYHNLYVPLWWLGELDRAVAACEQAVLVSERLGAVLQGRSSRANLSWLRYHTGDWDEALAGANAVISESEGGAATYFEYQLRLLRARIALARGQSERDVLVDVYRATEVARAVKDPQAVLQALAHAAVVAVQLRRFDEAQATAEELVALLTAGSHGSAVLGVLEVASVAETLGFATILREVLEAEQSLTDVWRLPFTAVLDQDYARAAALFAELGYIDEGMMRLKAAEQALESGRAGEAEEQLQGALTFFRRLGATRYIREAEALRAAAVVSGTSVSQ
ncbi:MAG TPA: AAA family ATPase [Gaiellaceae bacterium]